MFLLVTSFLTFFLTIEGSAQEELIQKCKDMPGTEGNEFVRFQTIVPKLNQNDCMLILTTRNKSDFDRRIVLTKNGQLTVFNGIKDISKMTSKSYFLFPRNRKNPTFSKSNDGNGFVITTPNMGKIYLNENGSIREFSQGKIKEKSKSNDNESFNLDSFQGILLDCGFSEGAPKFDSQNLKTYLPDSTCIFKDKNNRECPIQVNRLFQKVNNEPQFIYQNDIKLASFLRTECSKSNLDLSSLPLPPKSVIKPKNSSNGRNKNHSEVSTKTPTALK